MRQLSIAIDDWASSLISTHAHHKQLSVDSFESLSLKRGFNPFRSIINSANCPNNSEINEQLTCLGLFIEKYVDKFWPKILLISAGEFREKARFDHSFSFFISSLFLPRSLPLRLFNLTCHAKCLHNSESHLQHDKLAAHGKRRIEQTGSKFNLAAVRAWCKNKYICLKKPSTKHKRSTVFFIIQLHKSCLIVRKAKKLN